MDSAVAEREALVSVEGVTFGYAHAPVLVDISLSIRDGDFLAIIGPNGSGKTTLVKIILGLLKPDLGRVTIMGRSVAEFRDWSRIGYIPQKATHFDPLFPASAREVVAMAATSGRGSRLRTGNDEDAAIRQALAVVGMEDYAGRPIGRLSGGQQQRIFIARAIVNNPRILFLDEPTTGVDAETQGRFYDLLDRLNEREGITIVLITHDIGIVNRHVTQVACLNQSLIYHGEHKEFCRSDVFKSLVSNGDHVLSHRH